MERKGLHDGHELESLEALDLSSCHSIDDLLRAMAKTSFGGRNLGEAANVLETMVSNKDCFRILTLFGAMTPAKQSLVICDLIDRGWINAVISTGALMCHGLIEGVGMKHYKANPKVNDVELYNMGYKRIYDAIEPEINLNNLSKVIHQVLQDAGPGLISSFQFCQLIGAHLTKMLPANERAILKSAYLKQVPVYIPAFIDSVVA